MVDLPGYGYAKVPAAVRKNWRPMIESYLIGRGTLKGVVLLLDIRRSPDEREQLYVDWLVQNHLLVIPVLTKSDKLSKAAQKRQFQQFEEMIGFGRFTPILFSAKTRQGREVVWKAIEKAVQMEE